jgi:hypothetical protein
MSNRTGLFPNKASLIAVGGYPAGFQPHGATLSRSFDFFDHAHSPFHCLRMTEIGQEIQPNVADSRIMQGNRSLKEIGVI